MALAFGKFGKNQAFLGVRSLRFALSPWCTVGRETSRPPYKTPMSLGITAQSQTPTTSDKIRFPVVAQPQTPHHIINEEKRSFSTPIMHYEFRIPHSAFRIFLPSPHTLQLRNATRPAISFTIYLYKNKKSRHMTTFFMVGAGGFGPPKSETTDLQSAPFGRSGTLPYGAGERSRTINLLITNQLLCH